MAAIAYDQLPVSFSSLRFKGYDETQEGDNKYTLVLNGRHSTPLERVVDTIVAIALTLFTMGMIHVSSMGRELVSKAISGRKIDFRVRKDTIDTFSILSNGVIKEMLSFARDQKLELNFAGTLANYVNENKVSFNHLGYEIAEQAQALALALKMGQHLRYADFSEFKLEDSQLEQLTGCCPNIVELNLNGSRTITIKGFEHLSRIRQLEDLKL